LWEGKDFGGDWFVGDVLFVEVLLDSFLIFLLCLFAHPSVGFLDKTQKEMEGTCAGVDNCWMFW
jgi:hypothetical protein